MATTPRIMIVDDSSMVRATLHEMLEELGYEVAAESADAEQAMFNFKSTKPDLVLLDMILPGESGLSALKKMREHDPAAAVIMVTAVGQERVVEQAMALGARGIIFKPFSLADIRDGLQKVFSQPAPVRATALSRDDEKLMMELIQSGFQKSVEALAKMFGTQWQLATSSFRGGTPGEFDTLFKDWTDTGQYGVYFTVQGGLPFTVLLVFSPDSARPLVSGLTPKSGGLGNEEDVAESVLGEIGNILSNCFLTAMAAKYPTPVLLSVPKYIRGSKSGLLKEALACVKAPDDYILMCHVHMYASKLAADCDFLCVFSTDFVHNILQGLGK